MAANAPDTEVVMPDVAILFCDIRNFTTMAQRLSVAEVSRVLAEYFERACDCVTRHGGHHIKVMGDGLMAVFDQPAPAVAASLELVRNAAHFQHWLDTWLHGRGLPEFSVGVGLNAGEVMFARLGTGDASEVTPLGDAVNVAARLEALTKELGWSVVASASLVALAGPGVRVGRRSRVDVRGRAGGVDVCEILSLARESGKPRPAPAAAEQTLRDRMGGAPSHEDVVRILRGIAEALGQLHARGEVHGNLKPERVLVDPAGGVALAPNAGGWGTPYYCSPQAALGHAPTPADDFYSVGVILHELLTQRLPFTAESLELLVARHRHAEVPRLPDAHAAFQPLLDRLLAKAADRRFADAAGLAAFIDAMPSPAPRA
jgi:class 3 adenylate cyclase